MTPEKLNPLAKKLVIIKKEKRKEEIERDNKDEKETEKKREQEHAKKKKENITDKSISERKSNMDGSREKERWKTD